MQTEVEQGTPATSETGWQLSIDQHVSALYAYWSRGLDILSGVCGMLILLLLLPILALFIFVDSPGPIFYSQERLGYRGQIFRIYKFRSMRRDDERIGQTTWAQVGDPRITRVGQFLRPTHLDELPQVWNILRGEMSLIGPRPELPLFSQKLEKTMPEYTQRLFVKPGLTGLAQVSYNYGDTIEDERIKLGYDLNYIQNRSIVLDVKIMFKTIGEVIFGHGR